MMIMKENESQTGGPKIGRAKGKRKEARASTYQSVNCSAISAEGRLERPADVAVEAVVNIMLDGNWITTLLALPDQLDALAAGFLVCEGIVDSFDDLKSVQPQGAAVICESKKKKLPSALFSQGEGPMSTEGIPRIYARMKVRSSFIKEVAGHLQEMSVLGKRTSGTHSTLICNAMGELVSFSEDVSRSCSVDKAVGMALLNGSDLSQSVLVTTGRISAVTALKAGRAGIPVLVSLAGVLSSGIEVALRLGMTLAVYSDGPEVCAYTGADRIEQ